MRTACAHVILVKMLFLSGVAVYAQGNIPEYIHRKYPEDLYIIRSGIGETSEAAAEAARFEIAKYFESKIKGETLVSQWAQSITSHGKVMEDQLSEVSNTVIISATRDIPGIEIAATEYVKKLKTYEAWAVLRKNMYAQVLREKIQKIDFSVDDKLTHLPDADLARLRILSGAMRDLVLREQCIQDLFLLDSAGALDSHERLLYTVMTGLDSLIAESFDVGIIFPAEVNNNVKSGIIKGVVDAGIRLREYPDDSSAFESSDLVMLVEHEVSQKTTSFKNFVFHNIDWVLSVNAMDPSTQEVIDAFVQNDKFGGAQNEDQARDQMVKKILQSQVPLITTWVYKVVFKPEE